MTIDKIAYLIGKFIADYKRDRPLINDLNVGEE